MLENILTAFYSNFWAILPAKYDQIEAYLLARMRDGKTPDFLAMSARRDAEKAPPYTRSGSVAVLPIHGVIYPRGGASPESGLTTGEAITTALRAAVADKDVSGIVLDIDSPGGTFAGTLEAASAVREAGRMKPVHASVHPMAASGGYWLGSQANSLAMNPSAQVGSIGVMQYHVDRSKMLEEIGIKITDIKSVPLKNEAPSHLPLSQESRDHLQGEVDRLHVKFIGDVALGRGKSPDYVAEHFGKGRMLMADDALRVGMVDRIATLEEVVDSMRSMISKKTQMNARLRLANAG